MGPRVWVDCGRFYCTERLSISRISYFDHSPQPANIRSGYQTASEARPIAMRSLRMIRLSSRANLDPSCWGEFWFVGGGLVLLVFFGRNFFDCASVGEREQPPTYNILRLGISILLRASVQNPFPFGEQNCFVVRCTTLKC